MASIPNQSFNSFNSMGNWGQPNGMLGSGGYIPLSDPTTGTEMFSQPAAVGDWSRGYGLKPINTTSFGGSEFSPGTPVGAGAETGMGFLDKPGQQGWGGMALGAASSLAAAYMGMRQYGLAKQQLAENQRQFDTNFSAQKGLTNSRLEDRQRARVASNSGAYESVGSYMDKNGVK